MTIHACTLDIPLYMHRSNILLDAHLSAKIGDFGFTTEGTVVEGRTLVTAVSFAKTLGYSTPEKDTGRHSPKSDLFSYGCCNCSLWSVSGKCTFTTIYACLLRLFWKHSRDSYPTPSKGMIQYWYDVVIVFIVTRGVMI